MPCRKTVTLLCVFVVQRSQLKLWSSIRWKKKLFEHFKTQNISKSHPVFERLPWPRPWTESQASRSFFWRRQPQSPSSLWYLHCTGFRSVNKVAVRSQDFFGIFLDVHSFVARLQENNYVVLLRLRLYTGRRHQLSNSPHLSVQWRHPAAFLFWQFI